MAERRRPKQGYDFLKKQEYRQEIWDTFHRTLNPAESTVIILPSKSGKEIDVAISKGFKEKNIIAIDDDKAMLVWAPWRGKYPKIKVYAKTILEASEEIKKERIKIDAANLDLCGNLSLRTFEQIGGFIKNITVHNKNPVVAITMFKGREKHVVHCLAEIIVQQYKEKLKGISKRLGVILLEIERRVPEIYNITQISRGEYYNGANKMDWGIFIIKVKKGETHEN